MLRKSYIIGLLSLCTVVIIWSLSSFLTKYLEFTLRFKSIFLFTYISSSMLSLNLIFWYISGRYWNQLNNNTYNVLGDERSSANNKIDLFTTGDSVGNFNDDNEYVNISDISVESGPLPNTGMTFEKISLIQWIFQPLPGHYSHKDLVHTSLLLMPLWFTSHYLYCYSLLYTSIGSAMVIFSVSGASTLLLSCLIGLERITFLSIFGVALSFSGVALISWGDDKIDEVGTNEHALYGDIMVLLSALFSGLYTIFLKVKVPATLSKLVPMSLLFGYFGLIACILLFPIVVYMVIFQIKSFKHLTPFVFAYIVIEELFDCVIATILYAKAAILTTPTVASVGANLTVPCGILINYFYEGVIPSIHQIIGALLATLGIGCLIIS